MHQVFKFYDPLVWYLSGAAMHGDDVYNGYYYGFAADNARGASIGIGKGYRYGMGYGYGTTCGASDGDGRDFGFTIQFCDSSHGGFGWSYDYDLGDGVFESAPHF